MAVNITTLCWRASGREAPETEAGFGLERHRPVGEAELVHLGRDGLAFWGL